MTIMARRAAAAARFSAISGQGAVRSAVPNRVRERLLRQRSACSGDRTAPAAASLRVCPTTALADGRQTETLTEQEGRGPEFARGSRQCGGARAKHAAPA